MRVVNVVIPGLLSEPVRAMSSVSTWIGDEMDRLELVEQYPGSKSGYILVDDSSQ